MRPIKVNLILRLFLNSQIFSACPSTICSGRAEKSPAAQDAQPSYVDAFVRDFGDLFADEDFIKYAKLYKIMDAAQRIYILGVIVGHLERAGVAIPFTLR